MGRTRVPPAPAQPGVSTQHRRQRGAASVLCSHARRLPSQPDPRPGPCALPPVSGPSRRPDCASFQVLLCPRPDHPSPGWWPAQRGPVPSPTPCECPPGTPAAPGEVRAHCRAPRAFAPEPAGRVPSGLPPGPAGVWGQSVSRHPGPEAGLAGRATRAWRLGSDSAQAGLPRGSGREHDLAKDTIRQDLGRTPRAPCPPGPPSVPCPVGSWELSQAFLVPGQELGSQHR